MKLNVTESNTLFEALIDGYRDPDKLRIMVRLKLGENLASLSKEAEIETVILNLIEWAEANDKLLDLIWGANEKNPDNLAIKKITYQLYSITKQQWEKLCELLFQIKTYSDFLESACQQSFKSSSISEIDPRLVNLKSSQKDEDIKAILKDNLIKQREQSSRNIPSILEFAYCLSRMSDKAIDIVRDDFKSWVSEVANQLNIQLKIEQNQETQTPNFESLIIQPYLLIIIENQNADLLLQAELILQESDSETIIKQEPIYVTEQNQGVECSKKPLEIGHQIKQFIRRSYINLKSYRNQNHNILIKSMIIELFLPTQYLFKPMETIPIPINSSGIFGGESRKLGCEYQLIFRSLERFEIYQNNPEYPERLENNWKELNQFFQFQSPLESEHIQNKFEHFCSFDEEWQILEQRLRDHQKLGINVTSPLGNVKENIKILKAIIIAGIPFSLWITNPKITINSVTLEQQFINLLKSGNKTDLSHLYSKIQTLRGEAYNNNNPQCLGYRLGFLCDNPYRLPSRFQEDDALTYG
ncbi:effector-associated domain EAD1-containing protein [Crocosphaera sp. XPORK-15E]|uniref:VMAP-C domain-containing protein n=1 Tax=Crocosphaera sp. XPORK-15E TaxID=3110247 RepID=UPI002B217A83|nr:effector-associated domain EAD1-containing protein [Crocosphaera sp. XPORK-15E]MEA5536833.1 effector-associated domain EAD1-containing protein [Crocosphaera sp. XPORK-15E]